jgi:hypothetical protein
MRPLPILALVLLAGCASFIPATVARLAAMSPLEADPADIAVAVDLPEGLDLTADGVTLTFEATNDATGESFREELPLEQRGDVTTVVSVPAADQPRLRAFQARARDWENTVGASGSISVVILPCLAGDGPAADATVDISVRLAADGPFLPLVRGGALSEVADVAEIAQLPACP